MIKSFGVQYAGYIDMQQVGYGGVPVNDRWFPNQRLIEVFTNARDLAQRLERLGYDSLWTAEHHFQREGYECVPNVLLLNVYLATQTNRLRFGCGFNITPMWHPLRLAEDFAMADILTNGRVIFGVGRGYHTREVETFNAPMRDGEANRCEYVRRLPSALLSRPQWSIVAPTRESGSAVDRSTSRVSQEGIS